jgi:GH15 family glucan-1,4-alpha-glucosidase
MSYQPIENYGIIGNMRTVALVSMNGLIDWYCYPQLHSPSIFGAILHKCLHLPIAYGGCV